MKTSELNYFVAENGSIIVVSFVGSISKLGDRTFENCLIEFGKKKFEYAVINLHDVSAIDYGGIAGFVRFQKELRDRPSELRTCFIQPQLRQLLEERGAIRSQEICGNLLDALKSFGLLTK
jgi:anti-anti-sigma regulatory factor